MDIQNLVPVDYSNQRVLLTTQVAEVFNTTTERISHNFSENKQRFKEGEHFFKLTGAALREFKNSWDFSTFPAPFSKMANCLYLWTEQGAMLHCKMVNTDEAWKMLKDLITFYFAHRDNPTPVKQVPEFKPLANLADVFNFKLKNTPAQVAETKRLPDIAPNNLSPDTVSLLLAVAERFYDPLLRDKLLTYVANNLCSQKIL